MTEALKRKVGYSLDVEGSPSFLQFIYTKNPIHTIFVWMLFFHHKGSLVQYFAVSK